MSAAESSGPCLWSCAPLNTQHVALANIHLMCSSLWTATVVWFKL